MVDKQKDVVQKLMEELIKEKKAAYRSRVYRHDGSIIWLHVNSAPISGHDGAITGFVGMFTDITEHVKTEEALKESEEKYRILVENSGQGIVVTQDEKIKYFNKKILELSGYSAEELDSQYFLKLVDPAHKHLVLERYKKRMKGESPPGVYEFKFRRGKGAFRWVTVNSVLIKWEARPAVLSFFTDISEQKTTEEKLKQGEQRLKAERERFTRQLIEVQEQEKKRIARELHDDAAQNLSLIVLEADSLLDSQKNFSQKTISRLQQLREDVDRTQKDIRRYSHELRPGVLDYLGLEAAIENIVEDTNNRNNVKIKLNISGQRFTLSNEKELALFRIIQEAVNNIRKHSEATSAVISLKYSPQKVRLTVSDNGKGFDTTQEIKEVGLHKLGLISMRERAQLIEAKIKIKSSPGKGTIISVDVPLEETERAQRS
jgi:PAS domain S-box-containing protein